MDYLPLVPQEGLLISTKHIHICTCIPNSEFNFLSKNVSRVSFRGGGQGEHLPPPPPPPRLTLAPIPLELADL